MLRGPRLTNQEMNMTNLKLLNLGQIKSIFNDDYYLRAMVLFKSSGVIDLEIQPVGENHYKINAKVKGNVEPFYECEIELDLTELSNLKKLYVKGKCECPIGFNCKHIAAVMIKLVCSQNEKTNLPNYKNKPNDQALFQFKIWLSGYEDIQTQNEDPNFSNEFLCYVLSNAPHSEFKFLLEMMIVKPLKSGRLSKGRSFNIGGTSYNRHYAMNKNCVNIHDATICQMLSTTKMEFNRHIIEGKMGFNILELLISTKRLFWLDTENEPLQRDQDKKLLEKWAVTLNGNYKLKFEIQDGGYFTTTSPLIYVDPKKNTIGKVITELDSKELEHLMRMPVILTQHLNEISKELALTIPSLSLPEPIQQTIILNVAPQPILLLSCRAERSNEMYNFELILNFKYESQTIAYYPIRKTVSFSDDQNIIQITRELETEYQCINRLTDLGLILKEGSNGIDLFFAKTASFFLNDSSYQGMIKFWENFQEKEIPKLKEEGWNITIDKSFHIEVEYIDKWEGNIESEGENDWFSLSFDIEVNGEKMSMLPLILQAMKNYELDNLPEEIFLSCGNNKFVAVPSKLIKPTLEILYELFNTDYDGTLKLNKRDAARLVDLDSLGSIIWKGGHELRELGKKIKDFKGIQNVPLPEGFFAQLRDYQQQGLNWLQFLREYKFNGILADDMGLGKTIQTLAHLMIEKNSGRLTAPCLIVAPTSVISNWRNEAQKFAPALKVLVLHGPDRSLLFNMIEKQDIVLTTYPLLARDELVLLEKKFHYLILDEAQFVKNAKTQAAQVLRDITANHKLCLTGTPMQNHLGELWSLFDFLMPGFLNTATNFRVNYRTPIEKLNDLTKKKQLANRVGPFLLRRTKNEVALDLPLKTEITRTVQFDTKQAALYESIRLAMDKKIKDAIKTKGLAKSHILILDALLKLRQTCCDPRLLKLDKAKKVNESAKLEILMEMIPELLEEGRRILLFSQFTSMLELIEVEFKKKDISYTKLTGETIHRDRVIEEFKSGKANVFMISLKAGGFGLNLTEADTVIHYDPWWNPAVENQATDRAHRIGQDKPVFVYRLIAENTLEEKILLMQTRKKAIAESVYKDETGEQTIGLTAKDIESLFAPAEEK